MIIPSRRLAGLVAALALAAACGPQRPLMTDVSPTAQTTSCAAEARGQWVAPDGAAYAVEAMARGPDCERAVVTLVVRDADGRPALVWASAAAYILGLHETVSATDMSRALAEWIGPDRGGIATTADLPEWDAAEAFPAGEFPFHPESWVDQETYEALRQEAAPVFSFIQGRESEAVFVLRHGHFEAIGVQQFPG